MCFVQEITLFRRAERKRKTIASQQVLKSQMFHHRNTQLLAGSGAPSSDPAPVSDTLAAEEDVKQVGAGGGIVDDDSTGDGCVPSVRAGATAGSS